MSQLIPRLEFLIQSAFRQQKECPHCGQDNHQTVARKFQLIKIQNCRNCGLFFTSPIYKSWFFSELYDKFYQAEGSTTEMPTPEALANLIENQFQGSDKYFGDRITSISHFMSQYTDDRKLLEIGSSWGYFLYQAKLQGFHSTGIELSDTRRQYGIDRLGVTVHKSLTDLKNQKFGLIYTSHTLEHFTDLSTIFSQIASLLEPGGKLLVEVPNFDFFTFGNFVLPIIGSIHPIGFSSDFFQQNLSKYGLNILGFYDRWEDFPDHQVSKSNAEIILLVAEKVNHES